MNTETSSTQVVLVTGASRGIGRALAVGFAHAGYDLVVTDLLSTKNDLEKTADMVLTSGRKAYLYTADVSNREQVGETIGRALNDAGRIDVLVNNAAVLKLASLQDIDDMTWDAHFNVNVKGVHMMCQAVVPHMRARKSGRVINIASVAARKGVPMQGHYAATKAAVVTLTRVLAQEVGEDGITVNALCPGIILTDMARNSLGSEDALRKWEQAAALKRIGAPEDVVGPALFFASEQSRFVTGQALNVCGGLHFH